MSQYKRIGILGGMSPESTTEFYNLIVKEYYEKNKNYAYPEIVIFSVDFDKIIKLQESNDMKNYVNELMIGVNALQKAGADFVVIVSNTAHIVFNELQKRSKIPILSIVKNAAQKAKSMGMKKLLLLGTKITMQTTFYKDDFQNLNIQIVVPNINEQNKINKIIFDELVKGIIKTESKKQLIKIIEHYNTDGIILGCTELPLILNQKDIKIPLLDTLKIHVEATLNYAIR